MKRVNFSVLEGKTLVSVVQSRNTYNEDVITFTTDDGTVYCMFHEQDCCESVYIEDIVGDLSKLRGYVTSAYESSDYEQTNYDSETWTFYRISTSLSGDEVSDGHSVVIRWYGTSNGYYSESVNFYEVTSA